MKAQRIEGLHALTAGAELRAVDILADELRREQRRANRRLAKALEQADRAHLHRRLARLAR